MLPRLYKQVSLEESGIRPGKQLDWHSVMRTRILDQAEAAAARGASITTHVGNWLHDLRQVGPPICATATAAIQQHCRDPYLNAGL